MVATLTLKKSQIEAWIDERIADVMKGVAPTIVEQIAAKMAHGAEERAATPDVMQPMLQARTSRTARSVATKPGLVVSRAVRALIAGSGNQESALRWAKTQWGSDDLVVKALSANDAQAGGFLLGPAFTEDFIELLRPWAAIRDLNPIIWPMDYGTAEVPKVVGGATAGFIGENTDTTASNMTFGQLKLVSKSLRAMVPISNRLVRYSGPNNQVDVVVRNDMLRALGAREDLAFIRGVGTEFSPRGLRYWPASANVIAANATVNLANVTTDLSKLILALETANVQIMQGAWVFHPRTKQYLMSILTANGAYAFRQEMSTGMLWGYPFKTSTQIPVNLGSGTNESEVYFAEFSDVVIGESYNVTIDISAEASYIDPVSGTLVSSFSQDQTVIRAIHEIDFGMRYDESVAVLTGVKWF